LLSFVCFCEGLRMPARRRWRFAHRRAAYANLQGRKPARCRASPRQTLWEFRSAVFGRGSLTAGLGRCREEEEADRSIAIGGTALTQRRLNARRAVRHGRDGEPVIAARWQAKGRVALRCDPAFAGKPANSAWSAARRSPIARRPLAAKSAESFRQLCPRLFPRGY
jgi:hypothetical protein